MSKVYIDLNTSEVAKILHSAEMKNVLIEEARRIANNAGEHYEAKQMPTRVIAVPSDEEGEQDNYENNTLLKAVR